MMSKKPHHNRAGAILPLVAVLLTAVLVVAAFTLNTNWVLYHQINVQNSTDLAARASLVKILGDTEFNGRTDRAKALGARVYKLNLDRPDPLFTEDRIRFGQVANATAMDPVFNENADEDDAIGAVQIEPAQSLDEQRVGMLFRGFLDTESVNLNSDAIVSTRPIDVVLCLDASRSMNRTSSATFALPTGGTSINEPPLPGSRWFELVDTVSLFLNAIRQTNPNARIGLVTFGGGFVGIRSGGFLVESELDEELARREQGLTVVISNNAGKINQKLESYKNLPALGLGTSLFDGIMESLNLFNRPESSKHIIMLSDGSQSSVGARPGPLVAANTAVTDSVIIHTISFGGEFAVMNSIAETTGGSNFTALSQEQLVDAFSNLLGRFRVQLVD